MNMKATRLPVLTIVVAMLAGMLPGRAQLRLLPISEQAGDVGVGLALRRLATVGIFMHTAAHPDDENNGLLAMLSHGQGIRTTLVSATRGDGGQNEIGPELFDALAVLRTEELLAAHRFDGAEQFFARAVDFGYSFSVEETFEKWGRREILADYVRHIRTIRPDVIVALPSEGAGGGLHHQASSRITAEAFRSAADPAQFPEQISNGLRPWQAKKLYTLVSFGFRGEPPAPAGMKLIGVNSNVYDPLLGRTYAEIGSEARSMHKCQGMAQLLALPGNFTPRYHLADTTVPGQAEKDETTLFDGVDATIRGLAQYAGLRAPEALTKALVAIESDVETARRRFEADGAGATIDPLRAGLNSTRQLRSTLGSLGLDAQGQFEIDYRLKAKEAQFEQAILLAAGIRLEALVDDGLVTEGQAVTVSVVAANRGQAEAAVRKVALQGLEGDTACAAGGLRPNGIQSCEVQAKVTASAGTSDVYWRLIPGTARYEFDETVPFGAPFRPAALRARFELVVAGTTLTADMPVQYRYERDIFAGEKRMEPKVVTSFAVRATPEIAIVPAGEARATVTGADGATGAREIRVTVSNHVRGPATGEASLTLPAGWSATPPGAPVAFSREDEEQTVRFSIRPAPGTAPGEYRIGAAVTSGQGRFERGYQVVEYPHIHRRQLIDPPDVVVKVIDVKIAPSLQVGYIMGVGDQVPPAIQQLGARVEFLDADELAWGDLSRYDVIVTGVRAYERRQDLRAYNDRLIEYAKAGGTVIVQYNKFEFNDAQYAPFPAKVSSNRVTDENAAVQILLPEHPVFTFPNRLGPSAWQGWVQERGLYFLGEKDARYADLVDMQDSFENNRGPKRGALVEARVGSGRWIYVGLGLWRQLPAGTDGAYLLLANLLSLGKPGAPSAGR